LQRRGYPCTVVEKAERQDEKYQAVSTSRRRWNDNREVLFRLPEGNRDDGWGRQFRKTLRRKEPCRQ